MPITASPALQAWSEFLNRLPADLDLDALARSTKAIQRVRGEGVCDGASLLRLCLAHGPGGMSLQETAAWAWLEGVAELSAQSLNERLHRSVGFLAAILHRLLAAQAHSRPLFWPGRHLRIVDGSSLSQPGSKGTDWRLHVVYDLALGGFRHVQVTDRRGAESLLRCEPVAGEVLIADRGYAKARELRACLDASGPHRRDFIVRVGWKALTLQDRDGKPFSLIGQMQQLAGDAGPREWSVQAVLGSGRQPCTVPLRLLVMPLPAAQAETNRQKLLRKASKHQDKVDARSLVAAGFVVLATSLPQDIPADEIFAAYRLRWQVELAIKWLKSVLRIDELPTRTPAGSLCWLHAHLIMALLNEEIRGDFLESSP
jgi:hypothetical protein